MQEAVASIQKVSMAPSALVLSSFYLLLAAVTAAQQTGAVTGKVVDDGSLRPVHGAVVRVQNTALNTVTDTSGNFRIPDIPAGRHNLVIEHIAYGVHADTIPIRAGQELSVRIRLSVQAIQLTPLLVEVQTDLERRRQTTGSSFNEIAREEIDRAQQKGSNLAELLRDGMIGIRVSGERRGSYCVEYRGGGSGLSGVRQACREVSVFLDGVRVSAPSTLYSTMSLRDIERLEVLPPSEAGLQYGLAGAAGVLLVETRQGPRARRTVGGRPVMTGLDWSLEASPYRWGRVLGGSVVGTAAGLGVGLLIGDQCLHLDNGIRGLRSKCNALATVGAGFIVLALPAVGGSTAAHWAGATERSEGRILPSALLGTLAAGGGYFLILHGESNHSDAYRTAGVVLLTVGTPLVTTVGDRICRGLR
jgi:hypothetical protein